MKSLSLGFTLCVLVLGMVGVGFAESKITGKTVEYSAQGVVMKGYLAYDENEPVEKVTFLKTASSAGIKNRKLFSVIKSFYDPWCNVPVSIIVFLLRFHFPPIQLRSRKLQSVSMYFKEIVNRTVE